jgi:predicted enzyme related to lactoylglutathione lyase
VFCDMTRVKSDRSSTRTITVSRVTITVELPVDVQSDVQILRTVPNLKSSDLEQSRRFYHDTLGFEIVMDLEWIVTFASSAQPSSQVSVITQDPSGLHPALSIEVDDADAAHAKLLQQGYEVVYPLRNEPWGVRRFFARDPREPSSTSSHISKSESLSPIRIGRS